MSNHTNKQDLKKQIFKILEETEPFQVVKGRKEIISKGIKATYLDIYEIYDVSNENYQPINGTFLLEAIIKNL